MTDNSKLARWQGWSRTNGGNWINPFTKMTCFEHPDYLNDDAAAMGLLDTLVEKGLLPCVRYTQGKWMVTIDDINCNELGFAYLKNRREAVVAACLELIEKEAE